MARKSVDLPEPEAPSSSANSPAFSRRDRAVAPTFAGLRHVGLQENARSRQQLRRAFACANQSFEPLRSSAPNSTTHFLTAISFPATNHLRPGLAAAEIQKNATFSRTRATSLLRDGLSASRGAYGPGSSVISSPREAALSEFGVLWLVIARGKAQVPGGVTTGSHSSPRSNDLAPS